MSSPRLLKYLLPIALVAGLAILFGKKLLTKSGNESPSSPSAASAPYVCEDLALIGCMDQVARVTLTIAGTPIRLSYASATRGPRVPVDPVRLGGWSLDVLHRYDPAQRLLILGNGTRRRVDASRFKGAGEEALLVASVDASRLYVFDATGLHHLRTIDTTTGATLYRFTWSRDGLLAIVNAHGIGTVIERDAAGLPVAIRAPQGSRTKLEVQQGRLATVVDPLGHGTTLDWDPQGDLLAAVKNAMGGETRFEYDQSGRLSRLVDPSGVTTNWTRTATVSGFTLSTRTGLGRTTSETVQIRGDGTVIRAVTDAAGLRTEARVTATTREMREPDGTITRIELASDPRWGMQAPIIHATSVTAPSGRKRVLAESRSATGGVDPTGPWRETRKLVLDGRTWTLTTDPKAHTMKVADPAGRVQRTTFDKHGHPIAIERSGLATTTYAYDERGRVVSVTRGMGSTAAVWRYGYDDLGGILSMTDPFGHGSTARADAAGRIQALTLPGDRTVSLTYDSMGRLEQVKPPGGQGHVFHFRPDGQPDLTVPPGDASGIRFKSYPYDIDGAVSGFAWVNGRLDLRRDPAGRIVGADSGGTRWSVTYDAATGLSAAIAGPGATTRRSYDGSDLLTETWEGAVAGSVGRTLDLAGRVIGETVPGTPVVDFRYDTAGQLEAAGSLTIARDALTGLVAEERLGALTTMRKYDDRGRQVAIEHRNGSQVVYSLTATRDSVGRATSRSERFAGGEPLITSFGYDAAGRVARVSKGGGEVATYSYDRNGSLVEATGAEAFRAQYDAGDALSRRNVEPYAYDGLGRLASAGTGRAATRFHYDALGDLLSVTPSDGRAVTYLVDGFGRRIGKQVNGRVVRGWLYRDDRHPAAELDAAGKVVARFVYDVAGEAPAYIVKNERMYRLMTDDLGSVRLVVDVASGAIAQRLDYDAWGNVLTDSAPAFQPFGFAGGFTDADTGLVRFGARDYDPAIGRWLAPDPLGFAAGDTNLYAYVSDNPVSATDPTGLWPILPDTFGVSWGVTGIEPATSGGGYGAAGYNVQWFNDGGLRVYRYDPGQHDPQGLGAGIGISGNVAYKGPPVNEPQPGSDPWEGPFETSGLGLGPASVEHFTSTGDYDGEGGSHGYNGVSLGFGKGGPVALYHHETNYTCIWGCAGSAGDPHLTTADGTSFDFQAAGEYVALTSSSGDFAVQVRQEPWHDSRSVAVNTGFAFRVGVDRVAVYPSDSTLPQLRINGKTVDLQGRPGSLPHGGSIEQLENGYAIVWPDGTRASVTNWWTSLGVLVSLADARRGKVRGLYGDYDGTTPNDLQTRDGKTIHLTATEADFAPLHKTYGPSWRIRQSESLFDYPAGMTTASYDKVGFPELPARSTDLEPGVHAAAELICRGMGVSQEPFLSDCVLDVGMTGQAGFAVAAARRGVARSSTVASGPTQSFAISLGDSVSPGKPGPGAGRIQAPGASDRYTFTAAPGTLVYLKAGTPCTNNEVRWDLRDAKDVLVSQFDSYHVCEDIGRLLLKDGGAYTITVSSNSNATGDHSFSLRKIEPDNTFTIALGDSVSPGKPGPGAGRIETPGATDRYTFTAAPGTLLYLKAGTPCTNDEVRWNLRDAKGGLVSQFDDYHVCEDIGRLLLKDGGDYTITVSSSADATGEYSFAVRPISADQSFAIALGDSVSPGKPGPGAGRIETPGSSDRYTFTAAPGTLVYLKAGTPCTNDEVRWNLRDAKGSLVSQFDDYHVCEDIGRLVLKDGGNYTITVSSSADATGDYSFAVRPVAPDRSFAISVGDRVSAGKPGPGAGNIETPGAIERYVFTAHPGEAIYLAATPPCTNDDLRWNVRDASGTLVNDDETNRICNDIGKLILKSGGSYTITVFGTQGSDASGKYAFELKR